MSIKGLKKDEYDDCKTIFITGATGLLGSYLLCNLLENGYLVYVLARGKGSQTASHRVLNSIKFWNKQLLDKQDNLKVVEGDIVYPNLGIQSDKQKNELFSEVQIIIHSAALAELRAPLELIRSINVKGTANLLDFALSCKNLKKVSHISTAYIVGAKNNVDFTEDMLDVGQSFNNVYEQTKYEAEILVREYIRRGLDVSIFRPGMIMGDSKDGKTTDFRLFYRPLHFFSQEIYSKFPADQDCCQNLINVDTVVRSISTLMLMSGSNVYHLTTTGGTPIGLSMSVAAEYFGFKLPEFASLKDFDFQNMTPAQRRLAEPYIPYFNYTAKFISVRTQKLLAEKGVFFPQIDKDNILRNMAYCNMRGFIKRRILNGYSTAN